MKRRAAISVMSALALGCGARFQDEAEEMAYLQSLSNPTPEQWKRREALKKEMRDREFFRVPKVGETIRVPERMPFFHVYDSVDSFRATLSRGPGAAANLRDHMVGSAENRDRITVLGIGDDWVKIRVPSGRPRPGYKGPAADLTGYVERWWDFEERARRSGR